MNNIYIMIGISGSGKSTFSNIMFPTAIYLNADSIRLELCGDASCQTKNKQVFERLYSRLESAMFLPNTDIVIDNTSLAVSDRNKIYKIINDHILKNEWKVVLIYFVPDYKKSISWNSKRDRKVPDDVISKQFNKIVPPTNEEMTKYSVIKLKLL